MHEWHLVWRREMEQRQWDQIFISQGLYSILIHIPVCSFTLCPLQLHNLLPILIIFVWVCLCLPFSLQGELQLRKSATLIEFFCVLSLTHETFGRYQNTLQTALKKNLQVCRSLIRIGTGLCSRAARWANTMNNWIGSGQTRLVIKNRLWQH